MFSVVKRSRPLIRRLLYFLTAGPVPEPYSVGLQRPWTELESTSVAPLLDLTDPATRARCHFAFGLRDSAGRVDTFHIGNYPP